MARRKAGQLFIPEMTAPGTPPSGWGYLYFKSDGILYYKNDAGTEVPVTIAGSPSYPLLAPNGSATAPSYAFSGDVDAGMYMAGVGDLRLTVAGTTGNKIAMSDDGTNGSVLVQARGTGSVQLMHTGAAKLTVDGSAATLVVPVRAANGSAGAPSHAFTNDTDSGLYLNAAGDVRLAVAGNGSLVIVQDDGTNGTVVLGSRGGGNVVLQHGLTNKLYINGTSINALVPVYFTEAAAPSTPASGTVTLYAKSDGLLYSKDDAGVETVVTGGGTPPNIQTFTASGTWTKPAGATHVLVIAIGAGGGGGGGGGSGATSGGGGGGGGGGAKAQAVFLSAELGASETVTIGAVGTAGTGAVGAGSGTSGGAGGASSLGTQIKAYGGGGGGPFTGGATNSGGGGGGGGLTSAGASSTGASGGLGGDPDGGTVGPPGDSAFGGGGGTSTGGAGPGGDSVYGGGGGAAGGTAGQVPSEGGSSQFGASGGGAGATSSRPSTAGGGIGAGTGVAGGGAAAVGTAGGYRQGGGGGGYNSGGVGGAGGAGGVAGGGGGGAKGSTNGGAGGVGGRGEVIVITYF